MRALAIALAATALVAGGGAVSAKPKLTPEQRLEKLLDGRVAGKPTTCISMSDTRDMEIIDGVAVVYHAGSTLYVNLHFAAEHTYPMVRVIVAEEGAPQ